MLLELIAQKLLKRSYVTEPKTGAVVLLAGHALY